MQSLFYGAAAASVAGLLLGAGFKADPQPPMQPQQEAVYDQSEAVADDGFQPAYLQGAVYTPAAYDWASSDRPSQIKADAGEYRAPKLETVSYDADPPAQGDDIPTPAEPGPAAASAPSTTAPGPSTTPSSTQPGGPGQRQDDQNTTSARASSAAPAPERRTPAPSQPPPMQPQSTPAAPAPGQPQATPPQGPQDKD